MPSFKERTMINSIEQYLAELKKELAGSDRATIQDALSDAEEYLRIALNSAGEAASGISEGEALAAIIEKYGAPAEVAAAYKEIESRTPPAFARAVSKKAETPAIPIPATSPAEPVAVDTRPLYARFFGVYAEPRTWGSLLYLIFAMGTGIIYFTWAVTGLSISLGFLVLIIGIPFLVLFLLSVRAIALLEGRLVEALIGIRMPRRPLFTRKDIGWWQKTKNLFSERQTWTALVYMLLQMFLGIIYFTVIVTLIGIVAWLIGRPIWELALGIPAFVTPSYEYYTQGWVMPFYIIGGVLLLTLVMHLVKITGRTHGRLAKALLVKE
jgi:uncharacterized membrane protein